MKCQNPNCQQEIPDGSKFCSFCGTKQSAGISCPNPQCRATGLRPDAVFCPYCGTKLAATVSEPEGNPEAWAKHPEILIQLTNYLKNRR
jgi:hypothetical protein